MVCGSSLLHFRIGPEFAGSAFDELVFCELDRKNDKMLIYETGFSRSDIEKVMVNKTETFKQQADAKRRPRFSVKTKIINTYSIDPSYEFDIRTCKSKKL